MASTGRGFSTAEGRQSQSANCNTPRPRCLLRKLRLVVYSTTLIFCVVSASLVAVTLSIGYHNSPQRPPVGSGRRYHVGVASYNVFAAAFVTIIFGAALIRDLFWSDREESKAARVLWRTCSTLATVIYLGSAVALTVITATHNPWTTSTSQALAHYRKSGQAPLVHEPYIMILVALVLAWLSCFSAYASCILFFLSTRYVSTHRDLISHNAWPSERAPRQDSQAHFVRPRVPEMLARGPQRSSISSMRTTATTDVPRYVFPAADSKYSLVTEVVACVLEGRVVNPVLAGAASTAQSAFKHVGAGQSE